MKSPTQKEVLACVRLWRKRLGLQGWDLQVHFGKMDDDCTAACSAEPEYRFAILRFDLEKLPADKIDRYVCHELMHCYVWRLANCAHHLAAEDKSKEEWVRTEEETLTTQLEELLCRLVA